jgi:hypothetical protein
MEMVDLVSDHLAASCSLAPVGEPFCTERVVDVGAWEVRATIEGHAGCPYMRLRVARKCCGAEVDALEMPLDNSPASVDRVRRAITKWLERAPAEYRAKCAALTSDSLL